MIKYSSECLPLGDGYLRQLAGTGNQHIMTYNSSHDFSIYLFQLFRESTLYRY